MAGKSIRLFLIDGAPQGMRTAEIGNWSGIGLVCPRTELKRLGQRPEVRRTGVYILVGPSDQATSGKAVYVGEGDDVWERLTSHDSKKDFWNSVVIFVSKDHNLTKAHVRWMEATLLGEIRAANRVEILNGNQSPGSSLPDADVADMQTFFEHARLLLPVVGVDVFAIERPTRDVGTPVVSELRLELKWEDAKAECKVHDGLFIVTKGSTARVKEVDSLSEYVREQRKRLLKAGVLAPIKGSATLLRFNQDFAFDSPSAAANVVSGTGVNGRKEWKVKGTRGTSYKDWQDQQLGVENDRETVESK